MTSDNRLKGRLALITGASGGIGSSCARQLWAQGMSLALTYSSGKARLDAVIADLESTRSSQHQTISAHQVDLQRPTDLDRLFAEISGADAHGHPPDVVIANAGYAKVIPQIEQIPLEEFDNMITVNLRSTFILTKLSLPWMKQQHWGRLIFVSSIAADGGGINGCHYAASKAGMNGMMKNLAGKLAKDGITVNSVSPAMIGETGLIPDPSILVGTPGDVANIPVGRLGTPDECANVVQMFCRTGYLTGQNILLSGGLR